MLACWHAGRFGQVHASHNIVALLMAACRAWAWDPPTNYLAAAAGSEDGGLLPPELKPPQEQPPADKWCAPYAYKMRPELGCGGADKWTIEPVEPFPRRWDWWSGNIYCNGEHSAQQLMATSQQFSLAAWLRCLAKDTPACRLAWQALHSMAFWLPHIRRTMHAVDEACMGHLLLQAEVTARPPQPCWTAKKATTASLAAVR